MWAKRNAEKRCTHEQNSLEGQSRFSPRSSVYKASNMVNNTQDPPLWFCCCPWRSSVSARLPAFHFHFSSLYSLQICRRSLCLLPSPLSFLSFSLPPSFRRSLPLTMHAAIDIAWESHGGKLQRWSEMEEVGRSEEAQTKRKKGREPETMLKTKREGKKKQEQWK